MKPGLNQRNRIRTTQMARLTYHEAECAFFCSRWWKTYQRLWWTVTPRFSKPYSKTVEVALRHKHLMCSAAMRMEAWERGDAANATPLAAFRANLSNSYMFSPRREQLIKWRCALLDDERPFVLAERLEAGVIRVEDQSIKVLPWVYRDDFNTHVHNLLKSETAFDPVLELTYFIRIWCYPSSYMRYIGDQLVMPRYVEPERGATDA